MPLAPRWASTRGGASRAGQKVSTSRTGIEEAVKTVTSPGSAASARATAGSLIASPSVAAMPCAAAASAARQRIEPRARRAEVR